MFDINDFDETTTGPWEWDVKRLAVSVEICGRANGIKEKDRRNAVARCVHSYRDHIRQFSQMDFLDVWYDHLDVEAALDHYESTVNGKRNRTLRDAALRASVRDSDHAAAKLTYLDSGEKRLRFRSKPPELVPISELQDYADLGVLRERLDALYDSYRQSLYEDRRYVLNRYRYHDTARKVVGVGSVGTRAWVSILTGRGLDDPLMLQMKEANESVFERFVGRSPYATHGERVVQGQKLIQSTADVLLGWASFVAEDGRPRDYYVRQFWNGKGSIDIDHLNALGLSDLGRMCAWCTAHAHARTGDSVAIANYLGGTDEFDQAIAAFAQAYAEQNEEDYSCSGSSSRRASSPARRKAARRSEQGPPSAQPTVTGSGAAPVDSRIGQRATSSASSSVNARAYSDLPRMAESTPKSERILISCRSSSLLMPPEAVTLASVRSATSRSRSMFGPLIMPSRATSVTT